MPDSSGEFWAVIPVAGYGSRLRPHTYTRPKPLLHVAGQPIIGHILDQLVVLGIRRVALVVGYMGALVVEYVRSRGDFETVECVEQTELLGLGHAVSLTRTVVGGAPMVLVYGDTIFQADLKPVLELSAAAMLGIKQVEDPRRFGVVVECEGWIQRLVEKPEVFVSNQAIVGVNVIKDSARLFACLEDLIRSGTREQGEFQLTHALQAMVESGARLGTFPVEHWFDCGTQEALLETNRHLLAGGRPVAVPATETVILPPVHLDPSALIRSAVIGPYVSIGRGARVERAIVRNSIIGEEAEVRDILLEDSLVGFQALVSDRMSRINVGDLSQIVS